MTEAPVAYPTNTALGRFGIAPIVDSPDPFVSSMPLTGLVNPLTGAPTIGPLAVLVDHAAGLVNHYRKTGDEWTLTSELTPSGSEAPEPGGVRARSPVRFSRSEGTSRHRKALFQRQENVRDRLMLRHLREQAQPLAIDREVARFLAAGRSQSR